MMSRRIPQLDAVRGIAILVVIFHNQSMKYPSLHLSRVFSEGWMGVDLFFVLSGFLITGILLDTRQTPGYFRNFYIRRCLRIWPLYYSVILFMFVVVPWLRPSEAHTVFAKSSPWWAYPLFLQNILVPIPTDATGPLGVTWSLAVEEQFYLIWPLVIWYCSRAQVRGIAVTVICVSPVLRLVLMHWQVNLYTNPLCRLDGLMAGAAVALAIRSDTFLPHRFVKPAWIGFLVGLVLAFAFDALGARWFVYSLSALASVSFLYLTLFSNLDWLQGALRNGLLVYTGTISYGLYLLHKIPFDAAQALGLDRHPLVAAPALIVVAYGLAALSFNALERPFLRLKRFFEASSRSSPLLAAPA